MLKGSHIVNELGKYFKKHLTGSGTIKNESNLCTVKIPLLYTVKPDKEALDDCISKDIPDEMGTIIVEISITTYSDKIRVNIFNGDLTIDHNTYAIASFDDYETECKKVLNHSKKRISKNNPQYDFQFESLK